MDKYNFASFVAKINTQIKPSIKDSHHLQKRKKNRSHCFRMGFEKVAWKDGKIPANWMNSHMPLKLRNGLLGCTERGQRILHVKAINVVSWCAGEAAQEKKKKKRIPRPQATGSCCACVCHRLTEMTNRVTGEEQSSLSHLTGWPCGVHSSVWPAWAAKGAVPLSCLLQVRDCHSTKRSLSVGGCCGMENEFGA